MAKLSLDQIELNMSRIFGWMLKDQRVIEREFQFASFSEAMAFVNRVAEIAESTNHHPDITIRSNKVKIALTTHDENGLTGRDFSMAQKINKILMNR
ncbi:MAG: 4a-hydroxytetrahydrobiopterin dehydratase [Bacillaceae bacterium]|nr:4a-hydroxytetrahydrobiopterin dehydratase [Bacillaceae bacterium]